MSLVPMNLSFVDRSIQKTYSRLALSLPPTSGTVPPPQPPQLSDRSPHRNGLNVADRANDLEVHRVKLACRFRPLNFRSRRTPPLSGPSEHRELQPTEAAPYAPRKILVLNALDRTRLAEGRRWAPPRQNGVASQSNCGTGGG